MFAGMKLNLINIGQSTTVMGAKYLRPVSGDDLHGPAYEVHLPLCQVFLFSFLSVLGTSCHLVLTKVIVVFLLRKQSS